jgi:hypothetical protein
MDLNFEHKINKNKNINIKIKYDKSIDKTS